MPVISSSIPAGGTVTQNVLLIMFNWCWNLAPVQKKLLYPLASNRFFNVFQHVYRLKLKESILLSQELYITIFNRLLLNMMKTEQLQHKVNLWKKLKIYQCSKTLLQDMKKWDREEDNIRFFPSMLWCFIYLAEKKNKYTFCENLEWPSEWSKTFVIG